MLEPSQQIFVASDDLVSRYDERSQVQIFHAVHILLKSSKELKPEIFQLAVNLTIIPPGKQAEIL